MTDTVQAPANTAPAIADAYPLTALQTGMVFHSELAAGSATYHDLFTLTLHGEYRPAALAAALAEVTERHPVLRTSFNLTDFSEPLQLVHETVTPPVTETDWTALTESDARARLLAWREREKLDPIDWTVPPLLRTFVHRLPAGRFALTLSFHHAILDGWSVATLTTELLRRYGAHLTGTPEPVVALPIAYRDFVAEERAAIADPAASRFWQDLLADGEATTLPRLPGHPTGTGDDVDVREVAFDPATAAGLAELARQCRVPLRTVLLAAHLRVLALLSGRTDVTTGIVTHGRPEHEAGSEVLGLFLNAVPVRASVDRPTWRDLVTSVFGTELAILPHRAYPLFEIQRAVERAPLYEVLFDYRDFHVYQDLPGDAPVSVVAQDFFEQTNVPFAAAFSRAREDGTLRLTVTYQRDQFPAEWIEQTAGHYRRVLAAMAADPDGDPRPNLLSPADTAALAAWQDTAEDLGAPATLAELVAESLAAHPDTAALIWRDRVVDRAEFAAEVRRLTGALLAAGVRPGDVVGVLLYRSVDLLVAVHAILAAGAAYLPLDPDLPDKRLALMAGDHRIVTSSELSGRLASPAVLVDTPAAPAAPVPVPVDSLAYVIHTSGSTGTPKGVGVSHRAIVHRLRWMQRYFPLAGGDRVVHKTPFGFDVSVWELCWPLIAGATLVVAEPDGHRDSAYLGRLFAERHVTLAHFVPSMLDALLDDPDAVRGCAGLRTVVCSGEALSPVLARRFTELLPDTELHNLYGPTEAAVDVTRHHCVPGERLVPIGSAVPNTRLAIVDERGDQVPVGVPGELCLAGVQLAMGYLGRPGATAERFTPDPLGPAGSRRYHTGDLARWLPDGEIEYLGRLDDQVKVRGFRIEPGEIEAALLDHPRVRAAAVTVRQGNLVAYVVPADPDDPPEPAGLREHLAELIPPYMIPATFQHLAELPLAGNGKLDRKALPEPDRRSTGYWPPRDQVEARLATIWEELLGHSAIGIDDDFFELGGHSLLALRMTVRIRQELGRELPVATVLTSPTIRGLAAELRRPEDMGSVNPIVALRTTGDRPALFLSHALGGQVFRYRPLAARLGEDQPVYTIPARGLIPGQEPHTTLTEMADDYVRYIRSVRPHGPYVLGGFCIGGNIALEVARRLRADGEDVPVVFPVWSSADEPVVRSSLEDETMLMIHALAGGVNVLETVDLDELRDMSTDERLVAVINASAREERLRPDTADLEQARRYLAVFKANAQAVGYWKHEPYDGDVVLLQPVDDPEITPGDDHGWRSVVSGRFAVAPISGTRFTSVYEPMVGVMAAQMRKWMDDGFSDDAQ